MKITKSDLAGLSLEQLKDEQLKLAKELMYHYKSCCESMMNSGYVNIQYGHKPDFEKRLGKKDAEYGMITELDGEIGQKK